MIEVNRRIFGRHYIEISIRRLNIRRLGGAYLIPDEKSLKDLQQLVEELESMYPGIDIWFKYKIVPQLKNQSESFQYFCIRERTLLG